MERRICVVEGCKNLGRNKGRRRGVVLYDRFCEKHHRLRSENDSSFEGRVRIPNDTCEACGWNAAYCDRHRIVKERGYYRENVRVLCPNCHRLAHLAARKEEG